MTDPEFDVREIRESKVSYSTKELLERIDKRFERLEDLAHGMASRSDVDALSVRVVVLEQDAAVKKASLSGNQKLVAGVFALITLLLNALSLGPDVVG